MHVEKSRKRRLPIRGFYLSYGGGVGSEALRLWLLEHKWPFEAVYVDHGCDWPETQEFVKTIPDLTVLKPAVEGYDNLYDYCFYKKMVPSFMSRWCTDKFKMRVLNGYFKKRCLCYIGFTIDESHRATDSGNKNVLNQFPLIAIGWTRQDCIDYIAATTGNVPMRSSCWFCPYQGDEQWKELMRLHPNLYEKAKALEKLNMEARKAKGKNALTLHASGRPLEIITGECQRGLWDAR